MEPLIDAVNDQSGKPLGPKQRLESSRRWLLLWVRIRYAGAQGLL